jgi:hypothetical protein
VSALFGLSMEMVMHLWQNIHTHSHITWEIERINKSLDYAILPLGKQDLKDIQKALKNVKPPKK